MSYLTDGNMEWDVPKPFDGTEEERNDNRASHNWQRMSSISLVCVKCDAKDWHIAADYPCGTEPPRIIISKRVN